MSEILSTIVVVITILAGFAALVRWVRRDTFSGAPAASAVADAVVGQQRAVTRELADLWQATYEGEEPGTSRSRAPRLQTV